MIHILKGAKVIKVLLSHKEKLEKAAFSVKLSEECSVVIQRSLPQNEGDQRVSHYHVLSDLLQTGSIILERPFLATSRALIDVHEEKLSLRVENETVTFNIGKSMRSIYSRDDYLYCVNHTAKLVHEQWVDTVDHNGKWIETEEEDNPE
ncbi:hypothetical protein Tco_1401991 [Tanacetum coccineum]